MELSIIQQHNNTSCIVFFNGWGMDKHAIQHLECSTHDIYMYSNYESLAIDTAKLSNYKSVHIVAWSMGVWACTQVWDKLPNTIQSAIAINGTPLPMHNEKGIPHVVFEGTMNNWNKRNRKKFTIRMLGNITNYEAWQHALPHRDTTQQQNELLSIYNQLPHSKILAAKWSAALIGNKDMIFTPENQNNYWQSQVKSFNLPMPHYPFMEYNRWDEILKFAE